MALVLSGGWQVTVMTRDNNGNAAGSSLRFAGDLSQAEIEAAAATFAGHVQALSDAAVTSYIITRNWVENDAAALVAPNTSEVERKLRISLSTATHADISSIELPSPIFDIEQGGTDLVNTGNAAYAAFVAFLTSGLLLPGNGPQTYFGEDFTRAGVGTIVHRSRKRK